MSSSSAFAGSRCDARNELRNCPNTRPAGPAQSRRMLTIDATPTSKRRAPGAGGGFSPATARINAAISTSLRVAPQRCAARAMRSTVSDRELRHEERVGRIADLESRRSPRRARAEREQRQPGQRARGLERMAHHQAPEARGMAFEARQRGCPGIARANRAQQRRGRVPARHQVIVAEQQPESVAVRDRLERERACRRRPPGSGRSSERSIAARNASSTSLAGAPTAEHDVGGPPFHA